MTDLVQLLIATATALLGALGLAYWAYRAQSDRSAFVGLYLLFGIPGVAAAPRRRLAVLLQGDRVLGWHTAPDRPRVGSAAAAAIPRGCWPASRRWTPTPPST